MWGHNPHSSTDLYVMTFFSLQVTVSANLRAMGRGRGRDKCGVTPTYQPAVQPIQCTCIPLLLTGDNIVSFLCLSIGQWAGVV